MKFRVLLLVVTLLFASTGCAFAGIGAGVGAAFPNKTEAETTAPAAPEMVVDHEMARVAEKPVAEVPKHKGNHWLAGFLVGGAVDLVVGSVLAYAAVHSFGGLSAMGGM